MKTRSILTIIANISLLATNLFAVVKLPRKSRHLDLTREEVSDAESRAEEN
jgi:hypothetical protein